MNAAGHATRCRPEYREPADNCCLPGASSLELAPRAVDNSIAILGRTAPGNNTRGVLLFSRTLIPVRKNYLTRRAGGGAAIFRGVVSGRYLMLWSRRLRSTRCGGSRCLTPASGAWLFQYFFLRFFRSFPQETVRYSSAIPMSRIWAALHADAGSAGFGARSVGLAESVQTPCARAVSATCLRGRPLAPGPCRPLDRGGARTYFAAPQKRP